MILVTGGAFQGMEEFARKKFVQYPIQLGLEEVIYTWIQEGDSLERILAKAKEKLKEYQSSVVILPQMGSGLLPMNQKERRWIEAVGKVGCMAASQSKMVYYVVCGQGILLKK